MKQTLRIALVLLVAVTVSLTWGLFSASEDSKIAEAQLIKENQALNDVIDQREIAVNDLLFSMTEVEDQLKQIIQRENLVYNHSLEPVNETGNDRIIEEIGMIDQLIARSKDNIHQLEEKVKGANLKTQVFQNRVNRLASDIKEREAMIADLKQDLASRDEALKFLTVQIDSLIEDSAEKDLTLQAKQSEIDVLTEENNTLNKAYLAVGSFKELKDRGLVQRQGGFLWFGRTIDVNEDADAQQYMQVDIREMSQLPVQAVQLDLLSEHPADSYQIVPGDNDNMKVLEITNPEEFWKVSKYLVISKKS